MSRYIKTFRVWEDKAEVVLMKENDDDDDDDDEQNIVNDDPKIIYFKISAKLCVDKVDEDQVEFVHQWTHEHCIEFDKVMKDSTNKQEIEAMLREANIPIERAEVRKIIYCALDMTIDNLSYQNKRVFSMNIEAEIIDEVVMDVDNMDVHMEEDFTDIMFYFKIYFTKYAETDGGELGELVESWFEEFYVEWDESMDDNTNKERIKVKLLEANIPDDSDDIGPILENACREAHDVSNKNKRDLIIRAYLQVSMIKDDDAEDDADDYDDDVADDVADYDDDYDYDVAADDDDYESNFDIDIEDEIQTTMVPATKEMIDNLEAIKINEEKSIECSVCFEEFIIGSQATVMPCSHIFHDDCITQWLVKNNSCPLCRFELTLKD